MASLQDRLDKAFGALGGAAEQQPAWRPTQQQVFRTGAPVQDGDASSDEEYEEKQRRETIPGLAQSLADEDEPDEEGFRPSTAFCRALDAEDEYNEIDEVATGLLARREGAEALPPRSTQVLEDNIYEERSRQHSDWQVLAAAAAEGAAAGAAAVGGSYSQEGVEPEPASMEVEEPVPAGAGAAAAGPSTADQGAEPCAGAKREKKKVRFEGLAAPYVPPSRRPGFSPRCTELLDETGSEGEAGRQGQQQQAHQRQGGGQQQGGGQRRQQRSQVQVPDHVKHPERYTCYVLDKPLVVGGGVGQLAQDTQANRWEDMRQAGGGSSGPQQQGEGQKEEEKELERWEGPVGAAGSIKFRPRQQRGSGGGTTATAAARAGGEGSAGAAAPPPAKRHETAVRAAAPAPAFDDDDGMADAEEGGAGGGDVGMQEADAEPRAAAARKAGRRSYRSSRAADEAE